MASARNKWTSGIYIFHPSFNRDYRYDMEPICHPYNVIYHHLRISPTASTEFDSNPRPTCQSLAINNFCSPSTLPHAEWIFHGALISGWYGNASQQERARKHQFVAKRHTSPWQLCLTTEANQQICSKHILFH